MALVVRVLQHDFPIEREYREGHVLTAGEAAALNQLLVSNIRSNVTLWVVREARGRSVLTAEQSELLHKRISEYANNYQFKARSRAQPITPFVMAIREVAQKHTTIWANQNDYTIGGKEYREKMGQLVLEPEIQEEARSLVLSRQSVVREVAEELAEGLL